MWDHVNANNRRNNNASVLNACVDHEQWPLSFNVFRLGIVISIAGGLLSRQEEISFCFNFSLT